MYVDSGVGVTLSGLDINDRSRGVGFRTTELRGWWSPAGSTGALMQRPGAPGGWLTEADETGTRVVLKGGIESKSHADSYAMYLWLLDAVPVREPAPLVVTELGRAYHLMVRQEADPIIEWLTDTYVTYDYQLHSEEYRKLSGNGLAPTYSVTVGLPRTEGGRSWPLSRPSTIAATVVTGEVTLTDPGDGAAPPQVFLAIDGPATRPTVRSALTGRAMRFDIDVLAGQTLTVDLDRKDIKLNGVSRRNAMTGRWLDPIPGDVLVFDADIYNPDARLTVAWNDARK